MTDEDAAATGRILRHLAVVRPSNQQRRYEERDAWDVEVTAPNRNAIRSQPLGLDAVGLDDGGDDLPEAGFQRDTHLQRVVLVSERILRIRTV